jgi:hypothetical protein
MRLAAFIAGALALVWAPTARGDEEAGNRAYVAASRYGNCYAKSIPSARYGTEGETHVYAVEADADRPVQTYAWFAPQLRLECNVSSANDGRVGLSVVQIGPWPRGEAANADTLALAFYWNDQLLHRYSTLDIAGRADNVSASVSHYTVISEIAGYSWRDGNNFTFTVRTTDGRTINFDAGSGAILSVISTEPAP